MLDTAARYVAWLFAKRDQRWSQKQVAGLGEESMRAASGNGNATALMEVNHEMQKVRMFYWLWEMENP